MNRGWVAGTVARRLRDRVVALTLKVSPSEPQRVFALTIALGAICGLVAVLFHLAIIEIQRLLIDRIDVGRGRSWMVAMLLVPTFGAALAGVLLHRVLPSAAGSGIPQVKAAYAIHMQGTRLRDAVGKFVICAIQLGTGSSLGREGPTVQICAAVAASMGRWLALSPANLRRLVPVGAAAGVAAAFNAPIAAVTFTIEEIVGTLDQTVLSGVVAAAALAAVVEHSVLGSHPIFATPRGAGLHSPSSLLVYALLGGCAALVSVAFSDLLLGVRARFRRSRIPHVVRPALGGLLTGGLGVVAVLLVQEGGVLGGGYGTLARALNGQIALHALALLCALKLLATVSSYSSGGAGGIFAPTLFVGAMLGGLFGHLDVAVFGHDPRQELSSFALVGMGAVFAGVVRAPMTSVLIVFEMTGGYGLVLPLMIANSTAYVLARKLRPVPIYEALLAQDGVVLPHAESARGTLSALHVRDAMSTSLVTLLSSTTLGDAAGLAHAHGHATYPVVDEAGSFVGLLSEARLARALAEDGVEKTVRDVAKRKDHVHADETLLRVVARMTRLGVRQLPVLSRTDGSLEGIVTMSDVMRAQVRHEDSTTADALATDGGDLRQSTHGG